MIDHGYSKQTIYEISKASYFSTIKTHKLLDIKNTVANWNVNINVIKILE